MAHEVESMFSINETPWHGLGQVLPAETRLTSAQAIAAAGLGWRVDVEPLFAADGILVEEARAVRRSDNGAILGVVGPAFRPVQNSAAFSFFDPCVTSGRARYETAGSLREGRRVWILARVARDPADVVPGDPVVPYVLLSNGHDGSLSCSIVATPIRVVCANTLSAALADQKRAKRAAVSIRHTRGADAALAAAGAALDAALDRFDAAIDAYRHLAARAVRPAQIEAYVGAVWSTEASEAAKLRDRAKRATKRAAELRAAGAPIALGPAGGFAEDREERASRILPEVTRLFEGGRGNALPGVRGTWWALYNATTEYLQHERRGTSESRLDSIAFGDGAVKSRRALDAALRMSAA